MRILAIDDDPTILEIIELFLEMRGYSDIHVAPSAEQAIKQMARSATPFDLILLDINMPGMSGISLIHDIIHHPVHRHARIVMLSALGDAQHVEDAFTAGAVDYMIKPFELPDLEASINAVERECLSAKGQRSKIGDNFRPDVAGMVQPEAIANCIKRISATNRVPSALAFIAVSPPDPTAEAAYFKALAQELLRTLEGSRSLLGYIGNRTFAVLSFGLGDTSTVDLEALITAAIAAADKTILSATPRPTDFKLELIKPKACGLTTELLAAFDTRRA